MTGTRMLDDVADALWRFQARADVLLDMRARDRIDPGRCAAEMERLWKSLSDQIKQEAPHALA